MSSHPADIQNTAAFCATWDAMDRSMVVAEFGIDRRLQRANRNFLHLLGYSESAAQGQLHRAFCLEREVASADYELFWQSLQNGEPLSKRCVRRHQDGSVRWLEATYSPVLDDARHVVGVVKVAIDVTERVRREHLLQVRNERLALVADATDDAVFLLDAAWQISDVNAGFTRMLGWSREEVLRRNSIDLLCIPMETDLKALYRQQLMTGQVVRREELVHGRDGQRYWASVTSHPVVNAEGVVEQVVTVLSDITGRRLYAELQRKVLEAMAREQPLCDVLDMVCREVERIAPDVCSSILAVDEARTLRPLAAPHLPKSFSDALNGLPIGPMVGSCGTAAFRNEAVFVDDIETDPLWAPYKSLALPLGLKACWSTPIHATDGKVIGTFAFYFRQRATSTAFHQKLVDACIHLCAMAMEREQSRSMIRQLAFYDGLTGLPNRSLLLAKADHVLAEAAREATSFAVLFIDLDRFKQVNDSLGHPAGDTLLRDVAQSVRQGLRGVDILGRLSGDEFVVVVPQVDVPQITDLVERLQVLLSSSKTLDGVTLSPSASMGIAMFPSDGRDMETLIQRADMAMYQAKASGRGRFRFFSLEMNELVQQRLLMESLLRDALKHKRLRLAFQPQIDFTTGHLSGVEALARWTDPVLGEVSPARFIPLAEECGLIGELGAWALHEACRWLGCWRDEGLRIPSVSVNLSPTSFHNLALPDLIARTLDEHHLEPQDLTLEITENMLLDTNPSTLKTLDAVHRHGVRISMDDFGTGYSSLSYLRRLPVSELKLDKSFVADIEGDAAAQALSHAILRMGESLQLTVVAEGVETGFQYRLLKEQGYHVAQGYLISKPLAPEDFRQWLQEATGETIIGDLQ